MEVVTLKRYIDPFIAKLDKATRAKTLRLIDLLEEHGSRLRFPYSRYIGRSLYELRVHGKLDVRLFYTFHNNTAYILHACIKKSTGIPSHEIQTAYTRAQEFVSS